MMVTAGLAEINSSCWVYDNVNSRPTAKIQRSALTPMLVR